MNSIEEILKELYAIDPSFKRHEADLRLLVRRLRLAKPDFSIDDAFVRRLRSDILYSGKPKPVSFLIRSYFIQAGKNLLRSSAFGTAVALVLLVPLAYAARAYRQDQPLPYQVDNESVSLGQQQEIAYKPENAFGIVALKVVATTSPVVLTTALATGTPDLSTLVAYSNIATSSSTTASSSAIFATTTPPAYIFTGSPVSLNQSTADVLETDTSSDARTKLLSHIQNLNFELTDLTSIANADSSLGTVQVQESVPFGYVVTMDLKKMTLTISKNPNVWPNEKGMPIINLLNATDTISTATAFLEQHNINTSNYGPAVLASENSASSTATVFLPLIINKQNVYNADGSHYGMTISVDQALGKVTSVTGISLQKYTASPYPMETDFNKVLNSLNATTTPGFATTTPELTTPVTGLLHYNTNSGEFFVPGLIFPITNPVASSTNSIAVPLLKS